MVDRDPGIGGAKGKGDRLTDAGGRPGYDRDLALSARLIRTSSRE
jgi:hypothetical protein